MKKKNPSKFVKVCPKCKSPDIRMDTSNQIQGALGLPSLYICNKCEHSSYSFPEVELSELKDFENEASKEKIIDTKKDNTPIVDTSYGKFEVRVIWKITSFFTIFLGIYFIFKLNSPYDGLVLMLCGLIMFYITYFKKRKLKEN